MIYASNKEGRAWVLNVVSSIPGSDAENILQFLVKISASDENIQVTALVFILLFDHIILQDNRCSRSRFSADLEFILYNSYKKH